MLDKCFHRTFSGTGLKVPCGAGGWWSKPTIVFSLELSLSNLLFNIGRFNHLVSVKKDVYYKSLRRVAMADHRRKFWLWILNFAFYDDDDLFKELNDEYLLNDDDLQCY